MFNKWNSPREGIVLVQELMFYCCVIFSPLNSMEDPFPKSLCVPFQGNFQGVPQEEPLL